MKKLVYLFFAITMIAPAAFSQVESVTVPAPADKFGSGIGFEILLTDNGFGIGGYYKHAISPLFSITTEINLEAGKDSREQKQRDYFTGVYFIDQKANFFAMMPIRAGIEYRLFSEAITNNFRPFLQLSAGPSLGWEWPYFDDDDGNGFLGNTEVPNDIFSSLGEGSFKFGAGGSFAIGANFGLSRKVMSGIRFGFEMSYFFDGVQLRTPSIDENNIITASDKEHLFISPTITLVFGRLR